MPKEDTNRCMSCLRTWTTCWALRSRARDVMRPMRRSSLRPRCGRGAGRGATGATTRSLTGPHDVGGEVRSGAIGNAPLNTLGQLCRSESPRAARREARCCCRRIQPSRASRRCQQAERAAPSRRHHAIATRPSRAERAQRCARQPSLDWQHATATPRTNWTNATRSRADQSEVGRRSLAHMDTRA